MNSQQARALVTETFPQTFNKERFLSFVVNLLNDLDQSKAKAWNTTYVKDAFKVHVKGYERLGTYTSPESEVLDVLVVYLTTESKLERARTAIRNFVADHLRTRDAKDAALVAFVSPTQKQWRFSYVKMEYTAVEQDDGKIGMQTRLTPARRSSYIVGEGESCHTAQARFLDLLQETAASPTLAEIKETFSVEAVTKEFFSKYAELFENIARELDALVENDAKLRQDFEKKNVRTADLAKKLMGQVMFLYFLQRKGWLGVERGKDWGTGPRDFLRKLAAGEYGSYSNFFNDVLEPLFYDTLATDRGHEAWCDRFDCRVPFLNGGLFEPMGGYDWKNTDLLLPNALFINSEEVDEGVVGTGMLDVCDRYNFTVNEAEPLEQEVAIDPEMLGKVFENLIEENLRKGRGAFYTPREIVHYMCKESLINYLDSAAARSGSKIAREDLETLVRLGDQLSDFEAVSARYTAKMPVRIRKNAKLLDQILSEVTICDPAVGSGAFPVGMMTEIVHCRNALTPYFNDVHERTSYAFKRHAIQTSLYGVDIDSGAVEIAKLRLWLSLVVDEEETKQIRPLPNLLYRIQAGDSLLAVEKNLFNVELFRKIEGLKPQYFDESDVDTKVRLRDKIDKLIQDLTDDRVGFDFEIYFSEVFNQGGGFDVIIGNPPYVQLSMSKDTPDWYKKYLKKRFKTSGGRLNTFIFFTHLGVELLRDGGNLAYIVPNTLLTQDYYSHTREELLKRNRLRTVVQYSELPFENAVVENVTIVVTKERAGSYPVAVLTSDLTRTVPVVTKQNEEFLANRKFLISVNSDEIIDNVFSRFEQTLGDFCDVNQAIALRGDRTLSLRESNPQGRFYKLLDGRNIGRYAIHWGGVYLEHDVTRIHSCKRKDIFETAEKLFFRRASENLMFAFDDDQYFALNTLVAVNRKSTCSLDLKYLLALLNSKLMNYIYRGKFKSTKTVFSEIQARTVEQLPIARANEDEQARLIDVAERILTAKRADFMAETEAMEHEIDEIVYDLYRLSRQERSVVDQSAARWGSSGEASNN